MPAAKNNAEATDSQKMGNARRMKLSARRVKEFMTLVAPTILETIWKHKRIAIGVGLLVFAIIAALFMRSCYDDYRWQKTNDELNKLESNTANSQIDVWADEQNKREANAAAENAAREVDKAREEANAARNNTKPATVDEANRNRCLAYPERCK